MVVVLWDDFHEEMNNNNTATTQQPVGNPKRDELAGTIDDEYQDDDKNNTTTSFYVVFSLSSVALPLTGRETKTPGSEPCFGWDGGIRCFGFWVSGFVLGGGGGHLRWPVGPVCLSSSTLYVLGFVGGIYHVFSTRFKNGVMLLIT